MREPSRDSSCIGPVEAHALQCIQKPARDSVRIARAGRGRAATTVAVVAGAGLSVFTTTPASFALRQPDEVRARTVLVVADKGHLSRSQAEDVGRALDRLVASVGEIATQPGRRREPADSEGATEPRASIKVFIVSGTERVPIGSKPGSVLAAITGPGGFQDDLDARFAVSLAEAREISRGNESLRDTVVRRQCGNAAPASCGCDVIARSRSLIEAYQQLAEDSMRSLTAIVSDHCASDREQVVFAATDVSYTNLPKRQLHVLGETLRSCGAELTILHLVPEGARGLKPTRDTLAGGTNPDWDQAMSTALEGSTHARLYRVQPSDDDRIDMIARDLRPRVSTNPHETPRDAPASARTTPAATVPTATPGPTPAPGPAVPPIVALASDFAVDFARTGEVLVASEHYVQEVKARSGSGARSREIGQTVQQRTLDSEVALVQIVADELWLLARDVLAVDGKPLSQADRVPLASLRPSSRKEALSFFKELAVQGARFNIGGTERDVNVPTLALWFLTPANRARFSFKLAGQERVEGTVCQVVRYKETGKQTLLHVNGRYAPARGRLWIAPTSGVVRKTELVLTAPERGMATITVQYTYSTAVQSWVPGEMAERYDGSRGSDAEFIVGRAVYSDYKRFDSTTRLIVPQNR